MLKILWSMLVLHTEAFSSQNCVVKGETNNEMNWDYRFLLMNNQISPAVMM